MSEEILLSLDRGTRIIKLNRPLRKNAFSPYIYKTLKIILNTDAKNDQVVVTIITGQGDYYSSGNDIKLALGRENPDEGLDDVREMVDAFINYPKLLIAVVNGPAIGIAATTAALCDIVYASDRAQFDTPFLKLGLCAEAASSFTFPWILGRSKASEMLFLGHKLSAQEAYQFGFVSKVISHANLEEFIEGLKQYGKLAPSSIKRTKRLITNNVNNILKECNQREVEELMECRSSEEFSNAVLAFLNKKSKL